MTKEAQNKITYIVYCVEGIADKYGMSAADAFSYLDKYQGLTFLDDCYEAEHQLPLSQTITDLSKICQRNGGHLL